MEWLRWFVQFMAAFFGEGEEQDEHVRAHAVSVFEISIASDNAGPIFQRRTRWVEDLDADGLPEFTYPYRETPRSTRGFRVASGLNAKLVHEPQPKPRRKVKLNSRELKVNAQIAADYREQLGRPILHAGTYPKMRVRDPRSGEMQLVYSITGELCFGEPMYPLVIWTYSLESGKRVSSYRLVEPPEPGWPYPSLCAVEDRNQDGVLDYFICLSHRSEDAGLSRQGDICLWVDGVTHAMEVQDPITSPGTFRRVIHGIDQTGLLVDALYVRGDSQGETHVQSIRARERGTGEVAWEYSPPKRLQLQDCRKLYGQDLGDCNQDSVPEIGLNFYVGGDSQAIWLLALDGETGQPLLPTKAD